MRPSGSGRLRHPQGADGRPGTILQIGVGAPDQVAADHFIIRRWDQRRSAGPRTYEPDLHLMAADGAATALSTVLERLAPQTDTQ